MLLFMEKKSDRWLIKLEENLFADDGKPVLLSLEESDIEVQLEPLDSFTRMSLTKPDWVKRPWPGLKKNASRNSPKATNTMADPEGMSR